MATKEQQSPPKIPHLFSLNYQQVPLEISA